MIRARMVVPVVLTLALLPRAAASQTFPNPSAPIELRVSPLIQELERQVAREGSAALHRFWESVTRRGTPIAEPLPGDTNQVLVTFLWRDPDTTKTTNVVIPQGIYKATDFYRNHLSRVPGTDVWHRSYVMPRDSRFQYRLATNVAVDAVWQVALDQRAAFFETFFADPLNPRREVDRGRTEHSVAELPGAPPQHWMRQRSDVATGRIDRHQFASEALAGKRDLWVYTPPGFRPGGGPYDLLVIFDGRAYEEYVRTPTILDNLLADRRVRPLIAVAINSGVGASRDADLRCVPAFARFVTQELVPWMRQKYQASPDPQRVAATGSSIGGLASTCVAFQYPDVVGNVISQSGSYWWSPEDESEPNYLARQFAAAPRKAVRFFLTIGTMEDGSASTWSGSNLSMNRHFRDVLRAKGYEVEYREYNGGHEYLNWRGLLPEGLEFVFGPGGRSGTGR